MTSETATTTTTATSTTPTTGSSANQWWDSFLANDFPVERIANKTIAITGCTSGTGFILAKACVRYGAAAVLLLNRPSERAKQAEEKLMEVRAQSSSTPGTTVSATQIETIPCDLQDFASVREAIQRIIAKYPAIDVLCNNAGVMAIEDQATTDGYDVQMQTNHLSHFLLTKELLPLLQRAQELRGEARIVNHTSFARKGQALERKYLEKRGGNLGGNGGWFMSYPKWLRYQQSKLANALFTTALNERLRGTGIISTLAHPGLASTNLQASSQGMGGLMWMVDWLGQSAEDGTMPLMAACFMPTTPHEGTIWRPSGRFEMTGVPVLSELDAPSRDPAQVQLLCEASEEACGKWNTGTTTDGPEK